MKYTHYLMIPFIGLSLVTSVKAFPAQGTLELTTSQTYSPPSSTTLYDEIIISGESTHIDWSYSGGSEHWVKVNKLTMEAGTSLSLSRTRFYYAYGEGSLLTIGGGSIQTKGSTTNGVGIIQDSGTIIATETGGIFSGTGSRTWPSVSTVGSVGADILTNITYRNGLFIEMLSNGKDALQLNNVCVDLTTYAKSDSLRGAYQLSDDGSGNYTLDATRLLFAGYNGLGDSATSKIAGTLLFTLDDADFDAIYNGASSLTLVLGDTLRLAAGSASTALDSGELNVAIQNAAGETFYGSFSSTDNNGFSLVWNRFDIIPEPSTATLSLLALAGLAARRRRV